MTIKPRIQRAFFAWLKEAQPRMKRKISILRRTDQCIKFSFGPETDVLRGYLNRNALAVAVEHDGISWDLLIDYDVCPQKVAGGHICAGCPPDARKIHANREALWHDHLFDPFFHWVNDTLAAAETVALHQIDGVTWARLLGEAKAGPDAFRIVKLEGRRDGNMPQTPEPGRGSGTKDHTTHSTTG